MVPLAEQLDDRYWRVTARVANERQARLQGNWQRARDFSEQGLALSPEDPRLLAARALLEYEQKDFGQGEAYLNRFLAAVPLADPEATSEYATPALLIPVIARINPGLSPALLNIAEARAEEILTYRSVTPIVAKVARAGRGLLAAVRNDPGRDAGVAQQHYDILRNDPTDVRGTILPTGIAVVGDALLGVLARAMGKPAQADTHFADALAFCIRKGCRRDLAWS
jgi:tetratricopeptide (TPR) repeat protein